MSSKDSPLGSDPKSLGEDREEESILEAIEVGSTHNSVKSYDLEKNASQANKSNHDPAAAALDWTGPDDPGNPQNWSRFKKAYHFWPVAFLGFACTTGSSIISPANQDIQESFNVSRTAAVIPLTVFVIGLALGPMLASPLSEQFGRSIVYKVTAPAYLLFTVGAGLSDSFASLVICRLFAGMASGPVLAVGSGTNADLYAPKDRAFSASMFIMMPFLGPTFGPVIGGFAAYYRGWRWTQWCILIIAGVAFLTALPMEETYKKVILQKRAKKMGVPPPPGPKVMSLKYVKIIVTVTLFRPIYMLIAEPIVLLFGIYNAFTFGVLFGYFAAYPYTFATVYNFTIWQTGLAFLAIGVGVLCAVVTVLLCDKFIYQKKHTEAVQQGLAGAAPEHRLYAAMIGAFMLPIGRVDLLEIIPTLLLTVRRLFWFAWTARSDIHWISPILAGIPFALGNLALFISSALYQMDVYGPLNGASAMAANGLMRYLLGACFPLWSFQMFEVLGVDWAASLLGFVCIALLPIPFAFYKFGPSIRAKSNYAPAS